MLNFSTFSHIPVAYSRNTEKPAEKRIETSRAITIDGREADFIVLISHHPKQGGERGGDEICHHPGEEHGTQGAVQLVLHGVLQEHVRCSRRPQADNLRMGRFVLWSGRTFCCG